MKLVEFYSELQGRPESKVALDMDTRGPSVPAGFISGVMLQASYSTITYVNNYTVSDRTLILVDANSGSVTITLPAASSNAGKYYIIKKVDSSGNQVTIKPDSLSELIDGESSLTLGLQYQYVIVSCSGVETGDSYWHIIGGMDMKLDELMGRLLSEQVSLLHDMLEELRQIKLHATSMTDEHIEPGDDDGR